LVAVLSNAPFSGFGGHYSLVRLSARCFFGQVCLARSYIPRVTLTGFGNSDWYWSTFRDLHGRFGHIRLKVHRCASRPSHPGFRQLCNGFLSVGIHRHLTIRSSRPRVVASAMCFTLRLHMSAAPPQGGLTQALGR
jgi:hypothetical protein